MTRILVASARSADTERWRKLLADALPDFEVLSRAPGSIPTGAKYAVVWSPAADVFQGERNLEAIFNLGAGVDRILALPGVSDIPLYRLEDAGMARQMSEYVIHALASEARGLNFYAREQDQGRWSPLSAIRYEDWPVGVMGLGVLGRHVATSVAALGYPVAGWARGRKALDGVEQFHGQEQFRSFLNRTRVLVNLLPLTPETRGIINASSLAELRPDAVVINIARGGHVVDEDLLDALDRGRVQAAFLDVFNEEPLPPGHAYWHHSKVRVTPHVAAITIQSDALRQIVTRIGKLERGEAATGLVRRDTGY